MTAGPQVSEHPLRVLVPLGGLAVVGSAFLTWVDRGAGSTVALHELGDLLLGGSVSRVVPRWAGLVPYAIPLLGAVVVASSGVHGRGARRAAIGAVTALIVVVGVAVALPFARHVAPSWGQALAGAGVLVAGAGLVLDRGAWADQPRAARQNDL